MYLNYVCLGNFYILNVSVCERVCNCRLYVRRRSRMWEDGCLRFVCSFMCVCKFPIVCLCVWCVLVFFQLLEEVETQVSAHKEVKHTHTPVYIYTRISIEAWRNQSMPRWSYLATDLCVCVYLCVCVCQTTNILEQTQERLNAQREVGTHTQAVFSDESCTPRLYSLVGYLLGLCIYHIHICIRVCLSQEITALVAQSDREREEVHAHAHTHKRAFDSSHYHIK